MSEHDMFREAVKGFLKPIIADAMADEIAHTRIVLYVDCELSDKQFQRRYTNTETGVLHTFPESLVRAEINPAKMDMKNFEEQILQDIENTAQTGQENHYLCGGRFPGG